MSGHSLAEIADNLHLGPGGWSLVIAGNAELPATASELADELTFLLEDDQVGTVHVLREAITERSLFEALAKLNCLDFVLLPVTVDQMATVAPLLDYGRSRLLGGPRGVVLTSEAAIPILANNAPNFWSWIGPNVWKEDRTCGRMDREARLRSLRNGTGLTDADVVRQAEAGTLVLDPIFSEWLVLLGRGDLLGN